MKKLTDLKEKVIIQHSLELNSRGFSPQLGVIRDMANRLLAVHAGGQVGIRWPSNFINQSPELKTCFNRKYDYQRTLNKDSKVIQQWFECVQAIISKYGIQESDIFNFDKTGFMIGIASTAKVVTASEKSYKPKTVQSGNREWATVIQGVSAQGLSIPLFIILAGQHHLSAWYSKELPGNWIIEVSETGWTTNMLGFQWIQHFEKYTRFHTTSK